jgi:tryptophanyl-tRNA synthetase
MVGGSMRSNEEYKRRALVSAKREAAKDMYEALKDIQDKARNQSANDVYIERVAREALAKADGK